MLRLTPLLLALLGCGSGQAGRVEPRSPEPPAANASDPFASASHSPFASLGSGVRRIDAQAR
ncbi:MAG TPA: hypothetical protein VER33_13810 [Polyangiaceae bacterium]|nr:hypothetical protein [Polyangiaceae bacterium]